MTGFRASVENGSFSFFKEELLTEYVDYCSFKENIHGGCDIQPHA